MGKRSNAKAADISWKLRLVRTRGGVAACVANVVTILTNEPAWRGVIAWSTFTNQIVKAKPPPWHDDDHHEHEGVMPPWVDGDSGRVTAWIEREWNVVIGVRLVEQAITIVAQRSKIHPVRDWLQSLRWDKRERSSSWLIKYAGADDTPYTRAVSRMFLVGAVARVMQPGCKVDHTLILEGKTGLGKSTLLRELFSEAWFLETASDIGTKDFLQSMRGKWGLELAELDSLSRGELSKVKAVLTTRVDSYRESYGRHTHDYPRQCIFTGTTEEDAYLRDEKGNRRFWPVRITRVEAGAITKMREQLWAEAYALFMKGEPWHVRDATLLQAFEDEQAWRQQHDPWEIDFAKILHGSRWATRGITTAEILEKIGIDGAHKTRADEIRAGSVFRSLGWTRSRARLYGVLVYLYLPDDLLRWRRKEAPTTSAVLAGAHDVVSVDGVALTGRIKARRPAPRPGPNGPSGASKAKPTRGPAETRA